MGVGEQRRDHFRGRAMAALFAVFSQVCNITEWISASRGMLLHILRAES